MKIRLIYWVMGIVLLLLFVIYLVFPQDLIQDGMGSAYKGKRAYFSIREEEKVVIRELVTIMAHTQTAVLPFKKGKLEALGAKLKGKVSTLEFLAVIFSEPRLVQDMKLLQKSPLKYKKFVEGLHSKMLRDYETEGFSIRVHHFAKHLGLNSKEFIPILNDCLEIANQGNKGAFRPMMDYLLKL